MCPMTKWCLCISELSKRAYLYGNAIDGKQRVGRISKNCNVYLYYQVIVLVSPLTFCRSYFFYQKDFNSLSRKCREISVVLWVVAYPAKKWLFIREELPWYSVRFLMHICVIIHYLTTSCSHISKHFFANLNEPAVADRQIGGSKKVLLCWNFSDDVFDEMSTTLERNMPTRCITLGKTSCSRWSFF